MYRSFDKDCLETLAASGYRYIVIGDRLGNEGEMADFEVIPSMDAANAHPSIVFEIESREALHLATEKQPVGLFLDVRFAMAQAIAA